MSEMVERVAKAICCPSGVCGNAGVEFAVCHCESFEKDARAAIAAMREPTDAMVEAMQYGAETNGDMHANWQAAIDEALK